MQNHKQQASTASVGNTPHPRDASQLTHLYKCTNRKCSARNLYKTTFDLTFLGELILDF
jgi:hypothetical protein